jgi:hypothetical protein
MNETGNKSAHLAKHDIFGRDINNADRFRQKLNHIYSKSSNQLVFLHFHQYCIMLLVTKNVCITSKIQTSHL